MSVIKRNNNIEEVKFDKIHKRIKWLQNNPYKLEKINSLELSQLVINNIYDKISTSSIDNYTANLSASKSLENIEYAILAGRIVINNCHKNTLSSFKDKMYLLYTRLDHTGKNYPLINSAFYKFVEKNQNMIEKTINYENDYIFDFFGFRTLEHGYLLKINEKLIERPQDMYMRVAIAIHLSSNIENPDNNQEILNDIFESYQYMSNKYFIHATPTLFNAGTNTQALASCFLLGTEDSLNGIMKTAKKCANISKLAGGIGFHFSNWRSSGALIRSTNGTSSGVVPFLRIFNDIARAFNQGGKRLGSFAAYMEPHHPDILYFLSLRRNSGDENLRTRDLFLALWISDLFMRRVKNDEEWSTFDPDKCRGLSDCYGEAYDKLYLKYEADGLQSSKIKARDIWNAIYQSQKESGLPYMLYKDNVNNYNNQENIGVIKSSNLCCEITIYSDSKEFGTCHLASICLPKFVIDTYTKEELNTPQENRRELNHEFPTNPVFQYDELVKVAGIVCKNLNLIIDKNLYPCEEAKKSSYKGRPIGIGVQGLADVFYKFKIPFDSKPAKLLNKNIFEAIYYGALSMSSKLAKQNYKKLQKNNITQIDKKSGSYPAYLDNKGSPLFNGKFNWELYNLSSADLSGLFDWSTLREHINIYGVRNSLLTALMPTASTSQLNSNIECFEPITSNMYKRKVLSGEYIIINKYMARDLQQLGLWTDNMIDYLKMNGGSIQGIDGISDDFKSLYKTAWEISQKTIMELCVDRQPFIDQSQSMNLFFQDYTFEKFNSSQFYAWSNKLKTGSYYIRTQPAVSPQKFTVNPTNSQALKTFSVAHDMDRLQVINAEQICVLCSS